MGFRIGTKVGKDSYISIGKSGTYMSTKVGKYRVSNFVPSETKSKKHLDSDDQLRQEALARIAARAAQNHDVYYNHSEPNTVEDPDKLFTGFFSKLWFWIKVFLGIIIGCIALGVVIKLIGL